MISTYKILPNILFKRNHREYSELIKRHLKKSEKTALLNKVKKVIKQDVQPIEKNVRVNNIDTWQEMFVGDVF